MQVPSLQIVDEVFAENASRHPEKRVLAVGGERIPIIICNPSLAVWGEMVAAALIREEAPGLDARVVSDCVLYPTGDDLAKTLARWPALPRKIASGIETKIGVDAKIDDLALPPAGLAKVLHSERTSYHAVAMPGGGVIELAIERPTAAAWELFRKAMKQAGKNPWPVLRDSIAGCVKGVDVDDMLLRFPGVAIPLFATVGQLVGAGAELEAGEW